MQPRFLVQVTGLVAQMLWSFWCCWKDERGAEVPEYVIVVAIIVMLAVVGLISVKHGILDNLDGIANCLSGTATGTAASCS